MGTYRPERIGRQRLTAIEAFEVGGASTGVLGEFAVDPQRHRSRRTP